MRLTATQIKQIENALQTAIVSEIGYMDCWKNVPGDEREEIFNSGNRRINEWKKLIKLFKEKKKAKQLLGEEV
jgi:hypothetical protein